MNDRQPMVYLLHFARPYHHARHYIGVALDGDAHRRLAEHLTGHGSPLVRAVVAAGIRVELVFTVPGDRALERKLHNRHGTRVCPRCKAQRPPRPRQYRLPFPRRRQPASPRRGAGAAPLWRLCRGRS